MGSEHKKLKQGTNLKIKRVVTICVDFSHHESQLILIHASHCFCFVEKRQRDRETDRKKDRQTHTRHTIMTFYKQRVNTKTVSTQLNTSYQNSPAVSSSRERLPSPLTSMFLKACTKRSLVFRSGRRLRRGAVVAS